MNLTCSYCQIPFTLSMAEKVAALQKMHAESLHHYDAHCPRCGRANAISRQRLEMFTPGWQNAIKEAAAPAAPQPAAPEPEASPAPVKAPTKKSTQKTKAKTAKTVKAAPKKAAPKPAAKKTKKK